MTTPTTGGGVTVTITQEQLDALLEERKQQVLDEVDAKIASALAPLQAELQNAVKIGNKVSMKAANGQFVCAEEGGPTVERKPFVFTSRSANSGPWESFEVVRGQ